MAALGQAITGIQHSMKNLLNVLKGGSYMVKTGLRKGDKALLDEGWEMVEEGISNMTDMASHMLHYAREQRLQLTDVDLVKMAQKIFTISKARFEEEGIELLLDVDQQIPKVTCDSELIHSVIMDLLSNSFDACLWKQYGQNGQPVVTLGIHKASLDDYIYITVEDNGEGIPEEVQAKIFTPFFSTKKKKGTGMGLAMVARSVSSHRGKITVESEPGKGANFKVLLPIKGPRAAEEKGYVEESLSR
jgi:signal transduction histidine kinase